jgi:hypothetical protein
MEQHFVITDAEREALRNQLLNGLIDDSVIEELLDVGKGAIDRYIDAGMPYLKLGRKRLYDVAAVNVWIRNRPQKNAPGRGPGRPLKRSTVG